MKQIKDYLCNNVPLSNLNFDTLPLMEEKEVVSMLGIVHHPQYAPKRLFYTYEQHMSCISCQNRIWESIQYWADSRSYQLDPWALLFGQVK